MFQALTTAFGGLADAVSGVLQRVAGIEDRMESVEAGRVRLEQRQKDVFVFGNALRGDRNRTSQWHPTFFDTYSGTIP